MTIGKLSPAAGVKPLAVDALTEPASVALPVTASWPYSLPDELPPMPIVERGGRALGVVPVHRERAARADRQAAGVAEVAGGCEAGAVGEAEAAAVRRQALRSPAIVAPAPSSVMFAWLVVIAVPLGNASVEPLRAFQVPPVRVSPESWLKRGRIEKQAFPSRPRSCRCC